jgi:hypothetical protein
MSDSSQMRQFAREIFQHALAEASIAKGFARHVNCERGILRVCEDLYDLQAYSNVLVVSLGKAGHTMASAQIGASLESWPVRSAIDAGSRLPLLSWRSSTPNAESMQAANAMLRAVNAARFSHSHLSAQRRRIVDVEADDERSHSTNLSDLSCPGAPAPIAKSTLYANICRQSRGRLARAAFPRSRFHCSCRTFPTACRRASSG